jgi:hypothetical protein
MGLYQILTDPSSFKFYADKNFINPNAVSTPLNSFGQKSIGYGDGNQPYIQIPLPENADKLVPIEYNKGSISFSGFNVSQGFQGFNIESGNLIPYLGSVIASVPSKIRYNPKSWGPDFLNRGNIFGLIRAADDVKRLTKYFTDFRAYQLNKAYRCLKFNK